MIKHFKCWKKKIASTFLNRLGNKISLAHWSLVKEFKYLFQCDTTLKSSVNPSTDFYIYIFLGSRMS